MIRGDENDDTSSDSKAKIKSKSKDDEKKSEDDSSENSSEDSSEDSSDSSEDPSNGSGVKKNTNKGKGKAKEDGLLPPSVGYVLFWLSHQSYHAQDHLSEKDAEGESDGSYNADKANKSYVASTGAPSSVERDHESRLMFLKGLSLVPDYQRLVKKWSKYYVSHTRCKRPPFAKAPYREQR
jgi:hypothetical protein